MSQHLTQKRAGQSGFTLVELAIVMIIIGLLIGGILKGQELISNARVAATVSQIKAIDAATSTFRDTYSAFPGDMVNAVARIANCNPANNTCGNGNGDGRLNNTPSAAPVLITGTWAATMEGTNFFGQLAQADLLGGVDKSRLLTFGQAMPEADVGGGFYVGRAGAVADLVVGGATAATFMGGNYLSLRSVPGAAVAAAADAAVVVPSIMARIDRKMDDGNPTQGTLLAAGASAADTTGCWNTTAPGTYNEVTGSNCGAYIRIQQ